MQQPHTRHRIVKACLAMAGALTLSSQAHAVVESGHWQTQTHSGSSSNLFIAVDQTTGGDLTGELLSYNGGVLAGLSFNAKDNLDFFVVKPGDILSNATLSSGTLPFISGPSGTSGGLPHTRATVGRDFYLGVRTRSTKDPGYAEAAAAGQLGNFFTSFGWAHFQVDAFGFANVVGSAMAFREGGIVAGTLQAVPEPSNHALMGIGLLALAGAIRANKARQTKE